MLKRYYFINRNNTTNTSGMFDIDFGILGDWHWIKIIFQNYHRKNYKTEKDNIE